MNAPDFETQIARIGRRGLWITNAQDLLELEQAIRFTNLLSRAGGPLEPRPGTTTLASGMGAVTVHTIRRIDDPARADWTRLFGAGTKLYGGRDNTTGLTELSTGVALSGNPIGILPYRSVLNGDPWTIIADTTGIWKIRKVGGDWQIIELGLTPPDKFAKANISDVLTTDICAFDGTTNAVTWNGFAGFDTSETPIEVEDVPTMIDVNGPSGGAVEFTFKKGNAEAGYYSWAGRALSRDLTTLQGGAVAASDDDYVHLMINAADPQFIDEVRIYFVCSNGFDPSIVPGTDTVLNTDAYVKAIRPHDFTNFVELVEDAITAGQRIRQNTELDDYLGSPDHPAPDPPQAQMDALALAAGDLLVTDPTATYTPPVRETAPPTAVSEQLYPGRGAWSEFGVDGRPLRRRDFTRIGRDANASWGTITGVIILVITTEAEDVVLTCDDWYLTGGYGPDSGPAEAVPYDYRYTHYDTRTGAESNPSPTYANVQRIKAMRNRLTLSGTAYAGSNGPFIQQRFYRRGGLLGDDWRYVGQSSTNGGQVVDDLNDTALEAASLLERDNDRPIQSVDLTGNGIRANPAVVIGPIDGHLIAFGDPYRPGHINWCKPENPDAWPVVNTVEVCTATERLLNGVIWGGGAYVFSRARMYAVTPNVVADADVMVGLPTECTDGLAAKSGLCVTPMGIAFVALDGIRLTAGGQSKLMSVAIDPIFRKQTIGEFFPIDFTEEAAIQLASVGTELWFTYKDTTGDRRVLVYDLLDEQWRNYDYGAVNIACAVREDVGGEVLLGGALTGIVYKQGTTTDAGGLPIACRVQTGAWDFGAPRSPKALGDVIVDADIPTGTTLRLTTWLNNDVRANPTLTINGVTGRRRFYFNPFGEVPQRARNISLQFDWSSTLVGRLWFAGVSATPEPDVTILRSSLWDPVNDFGGWLTGCTMVVDTNGADKRMIVEVTIGSHRTSATILTVNTPGRRKVHFSWLAVRAEQVRLRPLDPCETVVLYSCQWHSMAEPPRTARWDSGFEDKGDTYYTGLDLICDTQGQTKTIELYVDGTSIGNRTVNTPNKRRVHFTFGPARGHVYRFLTTDDNGGYLYGWEWQLQQEPQEQANWNQNYSAAGTLTEKYLTGIQLDCDTNGVTKTVEVQVDGVAVQTLQVNQNGRGILHFSWPVVKGKLFRLLPTDTAPGRLYEHKWDFVPEPAEISQWDSNWENHGDTYYTGLDLELDTQSATKTIEVFVDQVSLGTFSVNTTGRRLVHLTFGPGRGHVYRFTATDGNAGFLYAHKWHLEQEPSEQTNWNQNFTLDGTLSHKYLRGIQLECDTFGLPKTVQVQADGAVLATLTITQTDRGVQTFSWPATRVKSLRLLPVDSNPGRLYQIHWLHDEEPPDYARWDTNWQLLGDAYITGVDLEVDTRNQPKSVDVYVDQVVVLSTTVVANGRTLIHLTLAPVRGHLVRLAATDDNPGFLYNVRWIHDPEPGEQAHWNQGYTIAGTLSDKWVKGLLLEVDTFGQTKTIQVQIDGAVVETISVNTNGRQVVHASFTTQYKGRVLRLMPTDNFPSRLYTQQWIFDQEPLMLRRWEIQETDLGLEWFLPLWAYVTIRATANVFLEVTLYGQTGNVLSTNTYVMDATQGQKVRRYVPFNAGNGTLIKMVLTSPDPFALYREESKLRVQPWSGAAIDAQPFGNDDLDPARHMGNAVIAAATPGGA